MAQKFLVVGGKAYRDAFDAAQDPAFVAGACPVVEFTTTQRVNEFFHVAQIAADGTTGAAWWARTTDDIFDELGAQARIQITKIMVFPFIERKERSDKGKRLAA
jgi:hypothetical protein